MASRWSIRSSRPRLCGRGRRTPMPTGCAISASAAACRSSEPATPAALAISFASSSASKASCSTTGSTGTSPTTTVGPTSSRSRTASPMSRTSAMRSMPFPETTAPATSTATARSATSSAPMPTARAEGCVPINIFGFDSISPEAAAYVAAEQTPPIKHHPAGLGREPLGLAHRSAGWSARRRGRCRVSQGNQQGELGRADQRRPQRRQRASRTPKASSTSRKSMARSTFRSSRRGVLPSS